MLGELPEKLPTIVTCEVFWWSCGSFRTVLVFFLVVSSWVAPGFGTNCICWRCCCWLSRSSPNSSFRLVVFSLCVYCCGFSGNIVLPLQERVHLTCPSVVPVSMLSASVLQWFPQNHQILRKSAATEL